MFTGVVVESFAYVYQMPGGASLNREEMREWLQSGQVLLIRRRIQEALGRV